MRLVNKRTGQVIKENLKLIDSFSGRLMGLMFTRSFPQGEGVVIKPCQGVHTFFMRYPIDVILLDGDDRVVYAKLSLKPYRVTPFLLKARTAVEMPAGTLQDGSVSYGDKLIFDP